MMCNFLKCSSLWECFVRLVIVNIIFLKDNIFVLWNVVLFLNKIEVGNIFSMVLSGLEMNCYLGKECI